MYIHGQFKDINGDTIIVQILNGNKNEELVIGENGLEFSPSPIEIQTNCENLFEHIIKKSCTIRLTTNQYLGNSLFAYNPNQILVNVKKGNKCLFAGYVVPNIYKQPYANEYEEISINCVDVLSNLQYDYIYSTYSDAVNSASVCSFRQIINKFNLTHNIDIDEVVDSTIWFDGSKSVSTSNIFNDVAISENLFLGDSENDFMNNEEILFELLQYLNLHIIQDGFDYYIFDWNTQKTQNSITWININNNQSKTVTCATEVVSANSYSSDATSISLDEVYNKIEVKCEIKDLETVISSPLDDDDITSPFDNYQMLMEEYWCKYTSDGRNAMTYWANNNMLTDYKDQGLTKYFFQIKDNPKWKFYHNGVNLYDHLLETDANGKNINQWKFPYYSRNNNFACYLMSLGKTKTINKKDDSPTTSLNMENTMVISVNGELDDTDNGLTTWSNKIHSASPLAVYTNHTNGIYSPLDNSTTNYLVFSGKICLAPLVKNSGYYISTDGAMYEYNRNTFPNFKIGVNDYQFGFSHYPVPYDYGKGGEVVYYVYKFYEQTNPINDSPVCDENNYKLMSYPFIDLDKTKQFEYNYSSKGYEIDKISKVPILECELKIGDKYCVEEFETDTEGVQHSVFNWYTYNDCPTITEDGETVKQTTFSLGFNPAIGDYIIGKEYDIQTNFDYTYNIDAENGTAIPIRKEDNLAGEVSFKILGVVNATWDNVTKKTKRKLIFWKKTSWNQETVSLLSHISNIFIKDFQCKIYSNNGGFANDADKDLIYVSDVATNNFKIKDGIEFKINTALSSVDCLDLGVKNSVKLSNAINMNTNLPLASIHKGNDTAKAEELYCNDYYLEYYQPKLIVETDLHTDNNYFKRYQIGYLNKTFIPITQNEDIKNNSINLILREL